MPDSSVGLSVWCRMRYRQRDYATGGTVVKSAEGPPIAHSRERADEGKRLAGRGLRRALRMIQEGRHCGNERPSCSTVGAEDEPTTEAPSRGQSVS